MKNIKRLFNIEALKKTSLETIHRFPISIIYMLAVALLLFGLIYGNFWTVSEEKIVLIVLSGIVGFFLSVGVYLGTEGHAKRTLLQLFPIVFSVLFYFGFGTSIYGIENFVLFTLTLTGIISYLFFSPFLKNIRKKIVKETVFYSYFYKISTVFITALILGGVLFGLGAIGITAVQVLFDIGYSKIDNSYGYWAIIALSIVAPFFGLAQLPQKSSFSKNDFHENTFFSFLVKYIAIPFIVIYFIILYAYTIKVLLNFSEWPKGEVTWLVIGFSIFGYLTYIFSYAFEKSEHIISLVRKAFPYIVFPQIFMLFYAIYLRIAQYDITINRYFVVVFGLWLLGISLYYIISKNKKLITIPLSLTLITLLISIGPWSVYNLPEGRQLERLKTNLMKANILQNGEIIPLSTEDDISPELSKEIYRGIEYLCNFNNCESIKTLFPKIYADIYQEEKEIFEDRKQKNKDLYEENGNIYLIEDINQEYSGPSHWSITPKINEILKITLYSHNDSESPYQYIRLDYEKNFFPIDTNGYSKIIGLDSYNSEKINVKIDYTTSKLELYINEIKSSEYDISNVIQKLEILGEDDFASDGISNPESLTFQLEGAKLFIKNIMIKNPRYSGDTSRKKYSDILDGYLLIK